MKRRLKSLNPKEALPPEGLYFEYFNIVNIKNNDEVVLNYKDFIGISIIGVVAGSATVYIRFGQPRYVNVSVVNGSPLFSDYELTAGTDPATAIYFNNPLSLRFDLAQPPVSFMKPIWTKKVFVSPYSIGSTYMYIGYVTKGNNY